jgi:hypothetical protein
MILPLGTQGSKFGKWSLSWEGPFKVIGIVPENSYFVETLEGQRLAKALNRKYLKKYFLAYGKRHNLWTWLISVYHARDDRLVRWMIHHQIIQKKARTNAGSIRCRATVVSIAQKIGGVCCGLKLAGESGMMVENV